MKRMDFSIGFILGILIYLIGNNYIMSISDKKWKERANLYHRINK